MVIRLGTGGVNPISLEWMLNMGSTPRFGCSVFIHIGRNEGD